MKACRDCGRRLRCRASLVARRLRQRRARYDDFRSARDPLEGFNRAVFGVNEVLDESVFKPLATGYEDGGAGDWRAG